MHSYLVHTLTGRKEHMSTNTSLDMRNDPLFMRNQFTPCGKWGLPLIRKQSIDLSDVRLIACSNTRAHDSIDNRQCGVHFFVDDYRFNDIYFHPERSLAKYSQYRFLLTPPITLPIRTCHRGANWKVWHIAGGAAHIGKAMD